MLSGLPRGTSFRMATTLSEGRARPPEHVRQLRAALLGKLGLSDKAQPPAVLFAILDKTGTFGEPVDARGCRAELVFTALGLQPESTLYSGVSGTKSMLSIARSC